MDIHHDFKSVYCKFSNSRIDIQSILSYSNKIQLIFNPLLIVGEVHQILCLHQGSQHFQTHFKSKYLHREFFFSFILICKLKTNSQARLFRMKIHPIPSSLKFCSCPLFLTLLIGMCDCSLYNKVGSCGEVERLKRQFP